MLVLRISSMLALVLACILLIAAAVHFYDDPKAARLQDIPAATERFAETGRGSARLSGAASPLVAQAEAFATHLNPPKTMDESPAPESATEPAPSATPAAQLRLHATSYYPDQPGKSMALVSDPVSPETGQRWVKEGAQYRSFVIHEIRRGAIVYREGERVCEAAIDQGASLPSLVRDLRSGSRQVSAAVEEAIRSVPSPAGPNDVEITGN